MNSLIVGATQQNNALFCGMARTDPVRLLADARAAGVAIAAVNAVNLETMEAVVAAADDEGLPVILQISQNAARYAGLTRLAAIGRLLRDEARAPVVLHFDHAESVEVALQAFDLGFDSVMLEGANMPPDEQLAALRRLSKRASVDGGGVEAEAEITPKGARYGHDHLAPDRLEAFVEATRCTSLAIDIGSRHKQHMRTTRLDLERLRDVAAHVSVPLVLHGSSGVSEDDLLRAVHLGIAKVNVATALMMVFTDAVRTDLADPARIDPRQYLGAGREALRRGVGTMLKRLQVPAA